MYSRLFLQSSLLELSTREVLLYSLNYSYARKFTKTAAELDIGLVLYLSRPLSGIFSAGILAERVRSSRSPPEPQKKDRRDDPAISEPFVRVEGRASAVTKGSDGRMEKYSTFG
jgi:hypothetical protein